MSTYTQSRSMQVETRGVSRLVFIHANVHVRVKIRKLRLGISFSEMDLVRKQKDE